MPAVLAVDVGSSAVRTALYDSRGRALRVSEARFAYRTRDDAAGASEVDASHLVRVTARSITQSLRAARSRIAGVGVSTFWHGLAGTDERGEPITPLYLWSDRRGSAAAETLRAQLDVEAVRQRTGCPIHSSYWPAKLLWLRTDQPDAWRRAARWMSFGDLLFARLFGTLGTSLSMASGTGLFTLEASEWDRELIRELELDPGALPPIRESETGLRRPFRSRWPALADVPWFHAVGDGALANLGSGCLTPSRRSVTVGTSAAVRVMHVAPARRPIPPGLWRYRLDARRLVTGGALSSGGNVRDWLVRTLHVDPGALERALRDSLPGSHGLAMLPYLAGERSPGYAPDAAAAIRGATLATSALDVARAGLEAVTVDVVRVNRLLDAAAPRPRALVASGGGLLESKGWMQLVADATRTVVIAGRAREASERGAALFALEKLGLASPAELDPGEAARFGPRRRASAAFARLAERQAALYEELIASQPHNASGEP
ncbi:MAG TPA: gluconokinase [Candidatus Dormibacteraeota bacterium]|nr:gluconokinase [Candidatus Dormibacteraeota bacterium]